MTKRTGILDIGLVGCGRIAELAHLRALARLAGVRVTALAEPDETRRLAASRHAPGAALFADFRELLSGSAVDAVVVTLPPALHATAAIAAFDAGKHVYLEKPIATTLDEARAVIAAWTRSGRIGMVGFNYRFHPLYQLAREHLRASRLGELVAVRTVFSSAARVLPAWKQDRQSGGGALMELASHHVDLVHFLFEQPVVEVSALVRSQQSDADSVSLHLRLAGDLLVQSFCSINAVADDRFDIYGRKGRLSIDRYAGTLAIGRPEHRDGRLTRAQRELRWLAGAARRVIRPAGEPSHGAALDAFVRAIRESRPAAPDLHDGYRSLAIVDAAERSSTGQAVSLSAAQLAP